MKRPTTQGNAGDDLHGDGRNGYTDGNAGTASPPTRLNANVFNNLSEELARCIEGDGQTVDNAPALAESTPNYHQLGDAVGHGSDAMFPRSGTWKTASRFVVEGLAIEAPFGGLDAILRVGRYVFDGRRYFVTGEKMIAAYPLNNFEVTLGFEGTPANGDYVSTWDGFGLSSAVPVTTTRAAGVPSDNDALATQHATDIAAEGDLAAIVGDNVVVDSDVLLLVGGGLDPGTIETSAPTGASISVEYSGLHFALDPTEDTYFYIAPEDPSGPADPPDRATVYLETIAVASGAGAPSTPDGTMLIARARTDASDITEVEYFNRGPSMLSDTLGAGLRMQPENFPSFAAALVPHNHAGVAPSVDVGEALPRGATAPDNGGYIRNVYAKRYTMLSDVSSLQDRAIVEEWTEITTTAGGGSANVVLFDAADWPDGSSFYLRAEGVAIDPSDPTDGYSFRLEGHVHIDGGTPTLDGTGGSPPGFEGGAGAIAASVSANFSISSTDVRLTLTGHSADALRWFAAIRLVGSGDTP